MSRVWEEAISLFKPEILALAERAEKGQKVSLEEWEQLHMNSYERNYLLPFCTDEVLLKVSQQYQMHSCVVQYPSSYDEAIVSVLFPLVCQRLQEKS